MTERPLNEIMEFDHVVRVRDDGTVTDQGTVGVYAPEVYIDYDDMRDWQYREANPGYEREIGLTSADLADCDPELAREVAAIYARDNAARRANNQRTTEARLRQDNAELRTLLTAHGITPPTQED